MKGIKFFISLILIFGMIYTASRIPGRIERSVAVYWAHPEYSFDLKSYYIGAIAPCVEIILVLAVLLVLVIRWKK